MSIEDAAAFLATTVTHVRALVYRKQIPHYKVGRLLRFSTSDLQEWLSDQRVAVR